MTALQWRREPDNGVFARELNVRCFALRCILYAVRIHKPYYHQNRASHPVNLLQTCERSHHTKLVTTGFDNCRSKVFQPQNIRVKDINNSSHELYLKFEDQQLNIFINKYMANNKSSIEWKNNFQNYYNRFSTTTSLKYIQSTVYVSLLIVLKTKEVLRLYSAID